VRRMYATFAAPTAEVEAEDTEALELTGLLPY
jgi:hypothetical protein